MKRTLGHLQAPYRAKSKRVTGSGLIYAGPCLYIGTTIRNTGSDDIVVTIYDNTTEAAGDIRADLGLDGTAKDTGGEAHAFREAANGLWLDLTGSASVIVSYLPDPDA